MSKRDPGMGVNDDLQGIDYLGNMLYRIFPNRALTKELTEKKAAREWEMDPFIGLPLYADMTKTRVVMHHLRDFMPRKTDENPDPKPSKRFEATHEFDARSGAFQFRQHATPGFLNDEDDRTLNVVFDERHFMILRKGQPLPPTAPIEHNISTGNVPKSTGKPKGNDDRKKKGKKQSKKKN